MKIADFHSWLRKQPCIVCLETPSFVSHLKHIGSGGSKRVPNEDDWSACSMCFKCHKTMHDQGSKVLEIRHKINLWEAQSRQLRKYLWLHTEKPPRAEFICDGTAYEGD